MSDSFLDFDSLRKLREDFSKTCFETLLKYSFISSSSSSSNETDANGNQLNRMALTSMLQRCKLIVQSYAHDERLNANVPLPKARTNEMICVLRALCTLISSIKKAPKECGKSLVAPRCSPSLPLSLRSPYCAFASKVQANVWNQVIGLYPCLVECSNSPSSQISSAVKDALHHYFSLLTPP